MSVSILNVGGQENSSIRREYLCDTVADVTRLPKRKTRGTLKTNDSSLNDPCAIGSTALVCDDNGSSAVYILNNANQWVKL